MGQALAIGLLAAILVALVVLVERTVRPGRLPAPAACARGQAVYRLQVVGDANRQAVVEACIGTHRTLFMVDTGYAGAPVLHLPALACEARLAAEGACAERAAALLASLRAFECTQAQQEAALRDFVRAQACTEYTAGCTTRLMGIGTTRESTSDLILAPPIQLRTAAGGLATPRLCAGLPAADLLSTSRNAAMHILTLDYLLHASPCLLRFGAETLELSLPEERFLRERASFTSCATAFSGGSFVAHVWLNGQRMACTVDTGASICISLSRSAGERLRRCEQAAPMRLSQRGVNGEQICSDVVHCDVAFAGADLAGVPVLLNDYDLDDVDGYIGLLFLASFDLLMTPSALSCRFNGTPVDAEATRRVARPGACRGTPACAAAA